MVEVWNKIDMEEEGMNDDQYFDDEIEGEGEDETDETCIFNGEDGMKFCASAETEKDKVGNNPGVEIEGVKELADNNNVNEPPLRGSEEAMEGKQGDSDGWLYEDSLVDEDDSFLPWTVCEPSNKDCGVENESPVGPSGPHLRTSSITGVGLQELLELIDEKLKFQDEKSKTGKKAEGSIFNRK